jgi:hypothetical protein
MYSKLVIIEKPDECSICYENLHKVEKPQICGHWFHVDCLQRHFKPECPLCRKVLPIKVIGERPPCNIVYIESKDDDSEVESDGDSSSRDTIVYDIVDESDDDIPSSRKTVGYGIFSDNSDSENEEDYDSENPNGDNWDYEDV